MSRSVLALVVLACSIAQPPLAAEPQGSPAGAPMREIRLNGADPIVEFRKGAISPETVGLSKPRVLSSPHPTYTSEAMRAKITGEVELEIVVAPDGTVDRVRVVKGLDTIHGLDEEARKAALKWKFEPGVLEGRKVAVWCAITLTFRLH